MNEKIDRIAIVEYLNGLNPQSPLEVVRVSGEVQALTNALVALAERVNAPRQVKLWQNEMGQLKLEVEKLSHDLEEARLLNQDLHSLAERKTMLLAQKEMIQDLDGQQEEILHLKAFVSKYDLLTLRKELNILRENANEDVTLVKVWMGEILDFFGVLKSGFLQEVQVLLKDVEQNHQQLEALISNAGGEINLKKITLSTHLQSYDGELNQTQNAYNDLALQLNSIKSKLLEIKAVHSKNIASYETHFAQNKAIWGELGKRHHLDEHLIKLIEDIETNLKQFDQEIKGLVEKVDHLIVF